VLSAGNHFHFLVEIFRISIVNQLFATGCIAAAGHFWIAAAIFAIHAIEYIACGGVSKRGPMNAVNSKSNKCHLPPLATFMESRIVA